jgi:hypothetical protein
MTDPDLIRNCVTQIRRPFDAARIAGLTGIQSEVIDEALSILERNGVIKQISGTEAIWVRIGRYNATARTTGYPIRPTPEKAALILNALESGNHRTIRSISQVIGYSRQWVYVYLEAMMTTDVVKVQNGYYVAGDKSKLRLVGSASDKGIIGRIKGRREVVPEIRTCL